MTDQAFRQPVQIDSAEKTDSPIRNRVNQPVGCANSSAVEICPVCSENVFAHPTGSTLLSSIEIHRRDQLSVWGAHF